MQILSVALTNFKTHKEKQFEFQLGTNAICGENGAGKTSILEAIAWVLFNYQGSYRKEDLIRNGASSAQVRVTFISSRDHRTYQVQRSTSQGYVLYDPQLNERLPYTRTKDEVLPWLKQHLGVSQGTDLAQLFANTIGVPQGTFTIDFLLPPEKRKPIFDSILKVEEYRATYQNSNSLRKYSEAQSQRLKALIDQYEETLQSWEILQADYQQLQTEIKSDEQQLTDLEAQSQQIAQQIEHFQKVSEQVEACQRQLESIRHQLERQQVAKEQLNERLRQAQVAAKVCQQQQEAYDRFIKADKALTTLGESIQQRQSLLQQQQQLQLSTSEHREELARLEAQLEQLRGTEAELAALSPSLAAQEKWEKEHQELLKNRQTFETIRFQQATLIERLQVIESDLEQLTVEVTRLQKLKDTTDQIATWETQQHRLREQLSRLAAAQQFESELRELADTGQQRQDRYREQVTAALRILESWGKQYSDFAVDEMTSIREALFQGGILSKKLLQGLAEILADLTEQTDQIQLKRQLQEIQEQLQLAYVQKAELGRISTLQAKQTQLIAQRRQMRSELESLERQLHEEGATLQALLQVEAELARLENPKAKQSLLHRMLAGLPQMRETYQSRMASLKQLNHQMERLLDQLAGFSELESEIQRQQQAKQTCQAGYQEYLKHQQTARQLSQLAEEAAALEASVGSLGSQQSGVQKQLSDLTETFDSKAFAELAQQLGEVNSRADRLRGSLPQQQRRLKELGHRIEALETTAQKRDQAAQALKHSERVRKFVNYARKVYKTAGPRITERYVQHISKEADRLFRELIGRNNVSLSWGADYDIVVQEGGHVRPFRSLSGGEQMCAALAVRLALLKVLADIDVAFFDEPTTNMDRPRRASLADAIARIRSFKQLFVISHDDTFEQVTETLIKVEREY